MTVVFPSKKSLDRLYVPEILGLLGLGVHSILAWGHMFGQVSVLDEGLYLVKGILFATHRYVPFQDFGPLTNHMPLSFLIPGWIQSLVGPGIRSGRMMAFLFGLVTIVGLWVLVARVAGKWWAAVVVLAMAASPFLTKVYAQAISQVIVIAWVVWILVLILGDDRKPWHLGVGSALLGTLPLIRLNMLPMVFLSIGYLLWEHGKRAGLLSAGFVAAVLVVGHAAWWPGILKLWAYWLPRPLTPFLDNWREPMGSISAWSLDTSTRSRLGILLLSVRRHLLAWTGPILAILLLIVGPRSKWGRWWKSGIFMLVTFLSLTLEHAWAALANNYCVDCLYVYMAFFAPIGLVLLALVGSHWYPVISARGRQLSVLGLLLSGSVLAYEDIDSLSRLILRVQIPRTRNLTIQPGTVELSEAVSQKLGIPPAVQGAVAFGMLVLVAGGLAIFWAIAAARFFFRPTHNSFSRVSTACLVAFAAVWLAASNVAAGSSFGTYDCGLNVIQAVENAGSELATRVPPPATVYWRGSNSPVPLLYAPEVQIYPPQLNQIYSYRLSGAASDLERLGLWNPELDRRWMQEANYIVAAGSRMDAALWSQVQEGYDEAAPTGQVNPCDPGSALRIYRRLE